jgi:hypothetical protein
MVDAEGRALTTSSQVDTFFKTERIQNMMILAKQLVAARCFGADVQNAEQAFVKIQAGYEMNIPPVEAMNSLYIVNGKITIYGMAMTKRLRQKGWTISYREDERSCTVTIKKGDEVHSHTATADELLKMNSKAFKFAPKEKLRWHAISRLIRFEVPEVLDAGVAYIKEAYEDAAPEVMVATVAEVEPSEDFESLSAKVNACKDIPTLEGLLPLIMKYAPNFTKDEQAAIKKLVKTQKTTIQAADVMTGEIADAPVVPEPVEPTQEPPKVRRPIQTPDVPPEARPWNQAKREAEVHSEKDKCVDPECPIHSPAIQ